METTRIFRWKRFYFDWQSVKFKSSWSITYCKNFYLTHRSAPGTKFYWEHTLVDIFLRGISVHCHCTIGSLPFKLPKLLWQHYLSSTQTGSRGMYQIFNKDNLFLQCMHRCTAEIRFTHLFLTTFILEEITRTTYQNSIWCFTEVVFFFPASHLGK